MSFNVAKELASLSAQASNNCQVRGAQIIASSEAASKELFLWLQYLTSSHATGVANCLLDGTASAAREGAACISLGLVRPAINSLRLQIDLSLAWLFFKDHPVEWNRVQDSGDGFKLKTELLKYLGDVYPRFNSRVALLRNCKTRLLEDPYRLLSAHIHGQSEIALPQVTKPSDIVAPAATQDEAVELQHECSEYISDTFWSIFADGWAGVPADLKKRIDVRFKSPAQRADFFKVTN